MPITSYSTLAIEQAAQILADGGLVAFPTETVYGLGALATDDAAVARIFTAKNRPQFNPLISHFADSQTALSYGLPSPHAKKLAARYWPGPLTLILKRPDNSPISTLASAGADSLAVRVPDHPIAQELLAHLKQPVVAPSANPSGRISPSTAQHVEKGLGDLCDMIIDGGPCKKGVESTVIDCRFDKAVLLRPGPLTVEQIKTDSGIDVVTESPIRSGPLASPGQLTSHYAPQTRLRIHAKDKKHGEIFISFGPAPNGVEADFSLSEQGDLEQAASRLFAILHEADERAAKSIAIAPIPMSGLGRAINDRLKRAAAPKVAQDTKD